MMCALKRRISLCLPTIANMAIDCATAQTMHYAVTLESLNTHPLPQWYLDAKLGIFIHRGPSAVPGSPAPAS